MTWVRGRLAKGQGAQEGRSYDTEGGVSSRGLFRTVTEHLHAVHLPEPPFGVENNDGFPSRRD